MTQNRSSAVMQQRREPKDSLDDFPTPPWATRALCEWLLEQGFDLSMMDCREPAANRGYMVKVLREYFGQVMPSDVFDYGADFPVNDYLLGPANHLSMTDWTITNPPFRLAEDFITRALERSRIGVAMILRTAFLEGKERYRSLFSIAPPSHVLQFTGRVTMVKGRLESRGATATAYAWFVWTKKHEGKTTFDWLDAERKSLEREGDYPA